MLMRKGTGKRERKAHLKRERGLNLLTVELRCAGNVCFDAQE